ncbi:hypothetical protein GGU45_001569 [Niabella hirudinis]
MIAVFMSIWPGHADTMPAKNTGPVLTYTTNISLGDSTDIGGEKGHVPPRP